MFLGFHSPVPVPFPGLLALVPIETIISRYRPGALLWHVPNQRFTHDYGNEVYSHGYRGNPGSSFLGFPKP